ncbi:DUF4160 domain-containing protein [Synechococcus elongatus]|uniref:Uncharacterized protein SEE0015 n=3 Tax=Synechococcus elongatus TaxID=32046 RepID=Q79PF0_SYNE7|nr:DUF4160 domain-containing protein [Synechococcus elongatus]MBD2688574.1 DUF4160 domain-containing protein [Synechococcus elongatus FACHB-1061]AAM82690.1 unknown [Synechococcus elongatus PCC 7942 = FACHB-805]ABB57242.1 conserved hypothetical protein [Synechococcus elongatus PCC 7942 = FACHB-805]AJD58245.1 transcriptional regulator [Synechococcus elongatus UTEX 2973]MBD2587647.1 DUF4160 domain-containing protein [Synechococcus elongatus FACHB-242]
MPEISRFFGIIITMYYNDHAPPHFHVRYGQQKAIISIDTLAVLEGSLKPRTLGLVIEWAAQHQAELRNDWQLARQNAPLEAIEPLE